MDLSEVRETKIVQAYKHSTEILNEYLQLGWVILETYTRDSGEEIRSHFPCFVIGWPKELPAAIPEGEQPRDREKELEEELAKIERLASGS
jgi:hypothetical protein